MSESAPRMFAGGSRLYWRLAVAGVTASILVSVYGFLLAEPWSPKFSLMNDFTSFWAAGVIVRDGKGPALYDNDLQRSIQTATRLDASSSQVMSQNASYLIPFYNPPAMALLMVPLSLLPISWAMLLWSALSLLAMVMAVSLPLKRHPRAGALVLLLITFGPVCVTLRWGQMAGFLLLAVSLGMLSLGSGRPLLGGALFGILLLKPQYAAILALVFLAKRRWLELAGMMATGLLVALLSLAVVGLGGAAAYFELLARISAFTPPPESLVKPEVMINCLDLLIHLWPDIPAVLGSSLVLSLGAATALLSLVIWRGDWDPTSPRFAIQMLAVMLATLVSSPHSFIHGAVLLLAPLAVALSRSASNGVANRSWRPMLAIGYAVGVLVWWIEDLSWLLAVYMLVALGLLIVGDVVHSSHIRRSDRSGDSAWATLEQ